MSQADAPVRITLVSADFAPNVGGVAAHVVELGRALAAAGQQVQVVTLPLGAAREFHCEWQGMQVWRPRLPRAEPFYHFLLRRWLKGWLPRYPQDVLHVHGMRPLLATRGLGLPVIFTNHTSGYLQRVAKGGRELGKIARRLAHVSEVLAPSQELCDATRAAGYRGPVRFIPNGVDVDAFSPGESVLRARWGIGQDEAVVLLARRLVEKNGVVVFAEAATQLKDLPVRFVLAGDGPERAKVERILAQGGVLDRSILLGNVPNEQMLDVYRAADLSVLPSFMEATSITGLESMACGLPLVGTRVGGIPVLIEDGASGTLVEPGDPAALAAAIRELVLQPALRRRMGERARELAERRFSWRGIALQTLDVYRAHLGAA